MFFGGASPTGGATRPIGGGNGDRSSVLGRKYQPFSNPFFDQASTYTPPSIKSLFGFCRFYYLTHGIINAVITKASEYPVTDLIIQHPDSGTREKWEDLLLSSLNYMVHQYEINLDYFVYGNAFISASFPFRKKLTCAGCRAQHDALAVRPNWRYINFKFWLACPKCGQTDFATSHDDYYPKYSEIGLTRWSPENVHIFYNEATGRKDYGLDISPDFRSQVMMGRKDLIATTPEIFLEAVKTRRQLVFDKSEVFHMSRPGLSNMSRGWGIPLMMPVLKDAFYLQVMRKAQESVLLTHLVPQIFLFPQPATSGADPFTTIELSNWRDHIRRELARQRMDPSYYGILPFPIGHQVIGENGKSLLLMPEIQQASEVMVAGMGFPVDLVFGHGTYSGSSISMRMLENFFLSNVRQHKRLLAWVMRRIGSYLNWPLPEGSFKTFRMADDMQRQAMMLQMNQMGKISDQTLLSFTDLKVEDESQLMIGEAKIKAEAMRQKSLLEATTQGEAQLVMAKYQARAQAAATQSQAREMAQPRTPFDELQQSGSRAAGWSLDAVSAALAEKIKTLPPEQQQAYIKQLQSQVPEATEMLAGQGIQVPDMQIPSLAQAPGEAGPVQGVDGRPMPEKLPPRRAGGV
jgi:hypothetical protein